MIGIQSPVACNVDILQYHVDTDSEHYKSDKELHEVAVRRAACAGPLHLKGSRDSLSVRLRLTAIELIPMTSTALLLMRRLLLS